MGDPGGGSDFAGFYNHLGIPHADWGFGGAGGVYHSAYDSRYWMEKFGDPGYRYHAAAARIGAAMALRLANADILPYDYVEFARTMRRYLPALDQAIETRKWQTSSSSLSAAIERMARSAAAFTAARDSALGRALPAQTRANTNAAKSTSCASWTRRASVVVPGVKDDVQGSTWQTSSRPRVSACSNFVCFPDEPRKIRGLSIRCS